MENHIKMDDLGGKPTVFGNTYINCLIFGIMFVSRSWQEVLYLCPAIKTASDCCHRFGAPNRFEETHRSIKVMRQGRVVLRGIRLVKASGLLLLLLLFLLLLLLLMMILLLIDVDSDSVDGSEIRRSPPGMFENLSK